MDNNRADESSDESSDEEDVQSEGSEADQPDAHLEKIATFRQWLDTARVASRQDSKRKVRKYFFALFFSCKSIWIS